MTFSHRIVKNIIDRLEARIEWRHLSVIHTLLSVSRKHFFKILFLTLKHSFHNYYIHSDKFGMFIFSRYCVLRRRRFKYMRRDVSRVTMPPILICLLKNNTDNNANNNIYYNNYNPNWSQFIFINFKSLILVQYLMQFSGTRCGSVVPQWNSLCTRCGSIRVVLHALSQLWFNR